MLVRIQLYLPFKVYGEMVYAKDCKSFFKTCFLFLVILLILFWARMFQGWRETLARFLRRVRFSSGPLLACHANKVYYFTLLNSTMDSSFSKNK